jgi:hypothetical protein
MSGTSVMYEKSAVRRIYSFCKSDKKFVHGAAGAVEPWWSTVATAAKKEPSSVIVR